MSARRDRLSPRQREVLRLIARGMTDKQIADALGIKVGTVGHYAHIILNKLGAASRAQAVMKFFC